MKTLLLTLVVAVALCLPVFAADEPRMEDVVRSPKDYTGKTLEFSGATLSGNITKYDVAGVRKYYLTVQSGAKEVEAGFFMAPPDMADKLYAHMDAAKNYKVKLTCRIDKLVINEVQQWHGIVTRVDFLDADGKVRDTVKQDKK